MAVWVSGVLLLGGVSVVAGSCPAGRYGYRCSYQCHCSQVYCNSTSGCQNASCSRGWSGPTCQKENVALGKTTSSSSVHYPPSNAVNGDTRGNDANRCFHSAYKDVSITSAWWRVDLGEVTLVHDVIIYFRTSCACSKAYNTCEHHKATDLQVDNAIVLQFNTDQCPQKNVRVCQFRSPFSHVTVKVRRSGIQIYIADTAASPTDGVNCYSVTGNRNGTDIPDVLKVTCSGEWRYLVLYTTTVNNEIHNVFARVMDFCEVEVEVCDAGTFGADCDNYCHCDGDACNYMSGVCPSRVCLPGWQTDRCDTACVQGMEYGVGCAKSCSTRMCQGDASTCPRDTGRCTDGCQAGWKGEDCTTVCSLGAYGANCSGTCGQCRDSKTCHHVTGVCPDGCSDGWTNHTCTQVCSLGTYGANCSGKCGQCRDSKKCHHVAGACLKGCSEGWTDHTCTQVLKSLPGNETGKISPLPAGFLGAVAMLVLLAVVAGAMCLWRKGDFRMAKTSKESGTPETIPAPPVEVPTYDVVPEHDYTKLDTFHTEHYETLQSTVDQQNSDVSKQQDRIHTEHYESLQSAVDQQNSDVRI